MDSEMEAGVRWGLGFPKIGGTFLSIPRMSIIVFWRLYWVPPFLGTLPRIPIESLCHLLYTHYPTSMDSSLRGSIGVLCVVFVSFGCASRGICCAVSLHSTQ